MKVKELIQLLQTHDPEATVVVAGYEGGYDTATRTQAFDIVENFYKYSWMGKHENAEVIRDLYKEQRGSVPAVLVI